MSLLNYEETGKYDLSFKIVIIGDSGVGKSCLINRAAKGKFTSDYSPTLGFEFVSFTIKIEEKIVRLQMWDTCGQEAYRSLITNFYRNSALAIMVYSIDSRESFINIAQWLKEVKINSNPDVKIILIGNKCDLENERSVNLEEAQKFKEENGIIYLEETSAKTGLNTKKVLEEAAKILYNEHKNYMLRVKNKGEANDSLVVEAVPKRLNNPKKKRSGGCC